MVNLAMDFASLLVIVGATWTVAFLQPLTLAVMQYRNCIPLEFGSILFVMDGWSLATCSWSLGVPPYCGFPYCLGDSKGNFLVLAYGSCLFLMSTAFA
ncbi:unnamed protein product [Cuscuta campestris]|uniref:Uncharacterized protein n=1 Tax=Cuscuta campestris TaxID=132261 RepID=A0A484N088_9ASTE|nr:unnamed protein product [Cuscuta campestris]